MKGSDQRIYRFADVEVDPAQGCLRREGQEQHLRQQTFQVLLYLLERRDQLVTKDELIERIWQGAAVTDNALAQCVTDIRRALGDDPRQPRLIKTIPKAGYRFIGLVEEAQRNGSVTLSAREITSVEIEYEEEQADREKEHLPLSVLRVASPPRRTVALGAGLGAGLLLGISFVVWFGFRSGVDKPPAAEVTLAHAAGRKPVVVMYFENQSGSAELDWLREGLADMLIASLSRSGKLAVLSRQQLAILLDRSGHQWAKPIRLDEALEIARRTQAEVIALGSFAQMGERVRLDVLLHEARTGQLLTTESLIADKPEQILTQVDLLSLKLAGHLGAAPAEPNQQPRLAEAMTDNLEAWRCYSLAVEKTRAFHSEEAIQLLEKAVALDAQFAMAYARLGQVYLFGGFTHEFDRARRYLERAYQLRPRLTGRDRLYINFWYAYAHGEGADQVLRELIRQYPLEVEAYYHLSYSLRNQTRLEEAIEVIRQGLIIDPEAPDLYNRLGFCYAELGRYDEALAAHQRYVQLAPQEANAYDSLGMTCLEAGRYDQALAAFEQALALSPDFGLAVMHQGDVYARQGRYRTALAHYQRCLTLLSAGYHRGTAYNRLARLHLRRGELQQAAGAGRLELRNQSGLGAFLVALARGDRQQAEQVKAQYLKLTPTDSGRHVAARFVHYCEGLLALKSGRTTEALERFEAALRGPVLMWEIEGLEACLANAYLALGRLDEAIAEYERLLRLNPRYALAHYHLGQAWERKSDRDKARAAYERFLEIWKDADADVPEVIAAKQRLTVLR